MRRTDQELANQYRAFQAQMEILRKEMYERGFKLESHYYDDVNHCFGPEDEGLFEIPAKTRFVKTTHESV